MRAEGIPGTAVIETAHHYTLKDVVNHERVERDVQIAERIADFLQRHDIDSSKTVLVDGTRPETKAKHSPNDHWRWRLFIERDNQRVADLLPEDYTVMRESDYLSEGDELVASIQDAVEEGVENLENVRIGGGRNDRLKIGTKSSGQEFTLTQKIETYTHDGFQNQYIPSCPVLDACVYMDKLSESDLAITILPATFRSQQEEVRTLFRILNEEPNVIVVYTDPEEQTTVSVEAWHDCSQQLATEMEEYLQAA